MRGLLHARDPSCVIVLNICLSHIIRPFFLTKFCFTLDPFENPCMSMIPNLVPCLCRVPNFKWTFKLTNYLLFYIIYIYLYFIYTTDSDPKYFFVPIVANSVQFQNLSVPVYLTHTFLKPGFLSHWAKHCSRPFAYNSELFFFAFC